MHWNSGPRPSLDDFSETCPRESVGPVQTWPEPWQVRKGPEAWALSHHCHHCQQTFWMETQPNSIAKVPSRATKGPSTPTSLESPSPKELHPMYSHVTVYSVLFGQPYLGIDGYWCLDGWGCLDAALLSSQIFLCWRFLKWVSGSIRIKFFGIRTSYHWSVNSLGWAFLSMVSFYIFLVFFPDFYMRFHEILRYWMHAQVWQIWYDNGLLLMPIATGSQICIRRVGFGYLHSGRTCPTSGSLQISIQSLSYVFPCFSMQNV